MDVTAWLHALGLERYASAFAANDVDAAVLPTLTADDLTQLGVTSVGHRRKLLDAIAELRAPAVATTAGGGTSPAARPPAEIPRHLAEKILQSKAALEGELKPVTVLFVDVQGSMDLAEQLGPEAWHAILERFFQLLADGVHRYEGTVNQYTGDGIMALFGAPIAHEDHAQRAGHAAFYLREQRSRLAFLPGLEVVGVAGIDRRVLRRT